VQLARRRAALRALLLISVALAAGPVWAQVSDPGAAPSLEPVPRGWLSPRNVNGVKAAVACATTALLGIGLWLDRGGRRSASARARDAALATLGVAGLACGWNLFQFHFPGFAHPSETFHYYLGAKYFPELGYDGLYECVAVADAQAGLTDVRPMRDLARNQLVTTEGILADPARCTARFGDARWAEFRHDVDFFRARVPERRWLLFQQDHGYNATPAWSLLGHALADSGPVSPGKLALLWALDPLLLLAIFGVAASAFGWRIAAVAAIYWGTNYVAPYGWTGGSILRQDWLAASAVGIALLKRDRPFAGGALLAWAALLRIFPGCLALGVALGAFARMLRARSVRLPLGERQLAAGALTALVLGVGLTALAPGGLARWPEFVARSRVQLGTPLANHVGLITALSQDAAEPMRLARDPSLEDPMQPWKDARRAHFAERRGEFAAAAAAFLALFAWAAARQPFWLAAALGASLAPILFELTGYYWALLLVLAFPAVRRPACALLLCAFAAASWGASERWHWTDEIHVAISWLGVALALGCVLLFVRAPRVTPGTTTAVTRE
jgi:hypothetical protein